MQTLTVYYDGQCPLCKSEIIYLQSRNHQGLLCFVDFQESSFDAAAHSISCHEAMEKIHGRFANGEMLTGVPAFAEAYRRAGLPLLAWLLAHRWTRPVFDRAYRIFARHRQAIARAVGPGLLRWANRRPQ